MGDTREELEKIGEELKASRAAAEDAQRQMQKAQIALITANGKIEKVQIETAEKISRALRLVKRWDPAYPEGNPEGNAELKAYEDGKKYLNDKEIHYNVPIAVWDIEKENFTHNGTVPLAEYLESIAITGAYKHTQAHPEDVNFLRVFNSIIYGEDEKPQNPLKPGLPGFAAQPEYVDFMHKSGAKVTHAVAVTNGASHLARETLKKAQAQPPIAPSSQQPPANTSEPPKVSSANTETGKAKPKPTKDKDGRPIFYDEDGDPYVLPHRYYQNKPATGTGTGTGTEPATESKPVKRTSSMLPSITPPDDMPVLLAEIKATLEAPGIEQQPLTMLDPKRVFPNLTGFPGLENASPDLLLASASGTAPLKPRDPIIPGKSAPKAL